MRGAGGPWISTAWADGTQLCMPGNAWAVPICDVALPSGLGLRMVLRALRVGMAISIGLRGHVDRWSRRRVREQEPVWLSEEERLGWLSVTNGDTSHEIQEVDESGAPEWQPLGRFMNFVHDVEVLVNMHESGLEALVDRPQLLEARMATNSDPSAAGDLEQAAREAGYASQSVGSDLMFAHSAVGLWSGLEVLVEDLVKSWLSVHQEILEFPEVAKIRLPLAEYMRLSDDERLSVLVNEMQRNLRTELASGVTRFENLLSLVGIGGSLPEHVKKAIFELWQVRNLWAHRSGFADRKFVRNCPWLGYATGQRVVIDLNILNYYLHATHVYSLTLGNRCLVGSGRDAVPIEDCLADYIQRTNNCPDHRDWIESRLPSTRPEG
jgi:hypothetical protein